MADVQRIAQQQLHQQGYPDFYLPFLLPRIEQQQVMMAVLKTEANRLGLQVTDQDLASELKHGEFSSYLFPGGNYIGDEKYMELRLAVLQHVAG